jgi:hypothetical protein
MKMYYSWLMGEGGGNPWLGFIAEVRLYSRALTAAEVASVYTFRGDTYTPVMTVGCAAGTYTSSVGAIACTPCAAGTFGSTTGLSVCTPCPAGTFSAANGASACTNCSAGQWSYAGYSTCYSNTYPVFALITDWSGGTVRRFDLGTSAVTTLLTGLSNPAGVTVSALGDYALVSLCSTNHWQRRQTAPA